MKPRIYIDSVTCQEFKALGQARRAFVNRSIRGDKIALVRENGLTFEVTVNEPVVDRVTKTNHRNLDEVSKYLAKVI